MIPLTWLNLTQRRKGSNGVFFKFGLRCQNCKPVKPHQSINGHVRENQQRSFHTHSKWRKSLAISTKCKQSFYHNIYKCGMVSRNKSQPAVPHSKWTLTLFSKRYFTQDNLIWADVFSTCHFMTFGANRTRSPAPVAILVLFQESPVSGLVRTDLRRVPCDSTARGMT